MNDSMSTIRKPSKRKSSLNTMTKKEDLMSFEEGHVRMSLRMITPFVRDGQIYADPFPKILFLVDGKYVRMPLDSGLLRDLGDFMTRLGAAIEGVDLPGKAEDDIPLVRSRLSECAGAGH
ncbi:MAG: hypothetical protein IJT54_03720 [Candidatus Methanomethylophilaceae archaeon]|nr:hypothetical protein [Candidatus Methanomethylophilaceae archaeon]